MAKEVNKKAGFWSKFLSRIIDLAMVVSIVLVVAFTIMSDKGGWHFKEPYHFYLWSILFASLLGIQFILIPTLWNGKSIGMWIMRNKYIVEDNKLFSSIVKREAFFSILWIINILLVMTIINHTLINKYAQTNQSNVKYTTWDDLRIGVVGSVGSITVILQMFIAISSIVKKDKRGLNDKYANVWVVKINKFEQTKTIIKKDQTIKPVLLEDKKIHWLK